jgi:predicted acetylornithine/succinylornithine family transaminase
MNVATTRSQTAEKEATDIIALGERVLAPTYARPNILFGSGRGPRLVADDGSEYLDMTSGVAVTALGHSSEVVADALRDAAGGLSHTSNLFHTEPAIRLAADLVECSFADRVFFANSGAEAVEGAIKFARLRAGEGRDTILYFDHSFHGRTFGALAATDRPAAREPFTPLPEGFSRASWNDPGALDRIDESIAAVVVEPVQGEGGVRIADADWLRALRRRCDETGTLLIFDEVQCGMGRTGRLWAYEHSGVEPDLMTLAKPLAGGLPMGAVLMTEDVASAVRPGSHATTFGGGPIVASVARRVLEEIRRPELLDHVARTGAWLVDRLARLEHRNILEVRGVGLLVGIRVESSARVVEAARDERLLLVAAADDVVRLLPPLNVTRSDLEEAVRRLDVAIGRSAA